MQDIDYAAVAVKTAITEKFGRASQLTDLDVAASDNIISITHGSNHAEGNRDKLLAAVRKAVSYEQLWELLHASGDQLSSSGPTG